MIERMLDEVSNLDHIHKALSFIRMLESEGPISEYAQLCLLACLQQLGMQEELVGEIQKNGYPWCQLQAMLDRYRESSTKPVMFQLFEQLDQQLVQMFQSEQAKVGDATKV